jgi:Universal stress protein family
LTRHPEFDGHVIGSLLEDREGTTWAKIDLLVLGTRGRTGIDKLLLGLVADQIFHCVFCPVLTVGPWSRGAASQLALKNALFTTDLSSQSTAALRYVIAAAKAWRASIDILHVSSPDHFDGAPRMEAYPAVSMLSPRASPGFPSATT